MAAVRIDPRDLGEDAFRGTFEQAYRIYDSLCSTLNQFERVALRQYLHLPPDRELLRQVQFYPISLKAARTSISRRLLVLALEVPTA